MPVPSFEKRVVARVCNDALPAPMNTFSAVGDVNGDGRPDIVICGRNGKMVWIENRGDASDWPMHEIDHVDRMECGGSLYPLTPSKRLDVINGGDWRRDEIFWWENPGTAGGLWKRRLIAKTEGTQIHDTIVGDVTGDGTVSLVFTNQHAKGGTTIYRVPLPADPTQSPWPGLEAIATAKQEPNPRRNPPVQPEEGLAIGDVDGDGKNELVCGTHWYKFEAGKWTGHRFATGYITTKVRVADIDGDGRSEILLSEGDPCVYGQREGGKLAYFKAGPDVTSMWNETVLMGGLFDAHSLEVADLCGNGRADIVVGEVGLTTDDQYVGRPPRMWLLENLGETGFRPHIIDEGTGTHEAVLADMLGQGQLDIVGKPLHGDEKWNVHVWMNRTTH